MITASGLRNILDQVIATHGPECEVGIAIDDQSADIEGVGLSDDVPGRIVVVLLDERAQNQIKKRQPLMPAVYVDEYGQKVTE